MAIFLAKAGVDHMVVLLGLYNWVRGLLVFFFFVFEIKVVMRTWVCTNEYCCCSQDVFLFYFEN